MRQLSRGCCLSPTLRPRLNLTRGSPRPGGRTGCVSRPALESQITLYFYKRYLASTLHLCRKRSQEVRSHPVPGISPSTRGEPAPARPAALTWRLGAVAPPVHPAGGAEGVVVLVSLHVGHLPLLRAVLVRLARLGAGAGGEEAAGALAALGVLEGGTCGGTRGRQEAPPDRASGREMEQAEAPESVQPAAGQRAISARPNHPQATMPKGFGRCWEETSSRPPLEGAAGLVGHCRQLGRPGAGCQSSSLIHCRLGGRRPSESKTC